MSSLRWCLVSVAGIVIGASFAGSARAQTARSGGGGANVQLLQQLQQLASERTSMQAENTRMKKELEDLKKERDSLKSAQKAFDLRAKTSASALAQSVAQRESTEEELKKTKDQMQELIAKFRETLQTMREIETERSTTKQTLATRDQQLKVCIDRNLALYKLDLEALNRLEHQSIFSRVAASEPFTRLKRTQLENLTDEYRARAEDQRATEENLKTLPAGRPPTPTPAAPASAPSAPQPATATPPPPPAH